ncbi:hypothetical protein Rsub_11512 [Raphidocelis subcapitata]|uniref:Uncharacterized protein n=1 Tax=Raphidocelis subcapitata TaxID=307507 RepID=A0A2V0PF98_9CHLO|nr:hypothetical protein Rsub_11512 [Raphidocelis subcapitata]|eukprot:GBF98521.1 hypothetical protein Rsub_11512 [Raphidocelis subcapitata]
MGAPVRGRTAGAAQARPWPLGAASPRGPLAGGGSGKALELAAAKEWWLATVSWRASTLVVLLLLSVLTISAVRPPAAPEAALPGVPRFQRLQPQQQPGADAVAGGAAVASGGADGSSVGGGADSGAAAAAAAAPPAPPRGPAPGVLLLPTGRAPQLTRGADGADYCIPPARAHAWAPAVVLAESGSAPPYDPQLRLEDESAALPFEALAALPPELAALPHPLTAAAVAALPRRAHGLAVSAARGQQQQPQQQQQQQQQQQPQPQQLQEQQLLSKEEYDAIVAEYDDASRPAAGEGPYAPGPRQPPPPLPAGGAAPSKGQQQAEYDELVETLYEQYLAEALAELEAKGAGQQADAGQGGGAATPALPGLGAPAAPLNIGGEAAADSAAAATGKLPAAGQQALPKPLPGNFPIDFVGRRRRRRRRLAQASSSGGGGEGASDGADASAFGVALVNDVAFHDEVALGLMAALRGRGERLKVYLNKALFPPPGGPPDARGLAAFVREKLPGVAIANAYNKAGITAADVAVFASPEFNVDYAREFIAAARPRMVVVFIHEPAMNLDKLRYLVTLHPLTAIAALAPHVADAVSRRLNGAHVHWLLPTAPADCDAGCAEGFAVQGKFEASRRTYGSLWSSLLASLEGSANATAAAGSAEPGPAAARQLPLVNVVGSGELRDLSLPERLAGAVRVYRDLPYGEYFDTLCRSAAVLPLFNTDSGYTRDKISSSVLASLASGTPLLVPAGFLDTYSFLQREHVLMMEPGETEAAAMARLSASDDFPSQLLERRAALAQLRDALTAQATAKLEGLFKGAQGRPRHPGKYPPSAG